MICKGWLIDGSDEVDLILGFPNGHRFVVVSWFNVLIYRVNGYLVSGLSNAMCGP